MHWFLKLLLILVSISVIVLIILVLPKILPAKNMSNSFVSGLILRNQVWEGTIRIVGDTIALPTTTVIVKPGTRILVSKEGDKSNMDFLPWHLKSGINTTKTDHGVKKGEPYWDEGQKIQIHFAKFLATGSKELPIEIASDSLSRSPYDFNVIAISSGVLSNAKLSSYRRLEIGRRVTLRDSSLTEVGECAVCINSPGEPSIINNVFGSALRESIWVYKGSPRITDNRFNNLLGDGIRINPKKVGVPVVSFNNFEMPEKLAIDILTGGEDTSGVVSHNIFSGNSKIKIACDSKIRFIQNVVLSLIVFGGNGCGGSYRFGPNYFESKDFKAIMSERITKDRMFEVKIPTILNSPPTVIGIRSK